MTDQHTADPVEKLRASEVVYSLTGFDQLAIAKAFGCSFDDLDAGLTTYALVFVLNRRDGMKDRDAYDTAMHLPMRAVTDRFEDESPLPADLDATPAGKE